MLIERASIHNNNIVQNTRRRTPDYSRIKIIILLFFFFLYPPNTQEFRSMDDGYNTSFYNNIYENNDINAFCEMTAAVITRRFVVLIVAITRREKRK